MSINQLKERLKSSPMGKELLELLELYEKRLKRYKDQEVRLRNLTILYDISKSLSSILDLRELLVKVMDTAIEVTGAQRGFLMLKGESGKLEFKVARSRNREDLEGDSFSISRSVLQQVAQSGKPVYLSDISRTKSYSDKTSIVKLDLESVMCAPLVAKGEVIGVIYVDSTIMARDFTAEDRYIFETLASHAAISIENARLYEDLKYRKLAQEQSERLAALGRMAASIAHEIRNPLGIISNAHYFLLNTDEKITPDREEQYEIITQEIKQANDIIDNLLLFSRQLEIKYQPLDLNGLIKETLQRRFSTASEAIEVELDLHPSLPTMHGDHAKLRQVLLNIINNAVEAMNHKGRLRIETALGSDETIIATISDTGPGIPKDNISRIFDPFFTTKQGKKGTGLGLAICHSIIEGHGGSIEAKNGLQGGAVFTVRLPLKEPVKPTGDISI